MIVALSVIRFTYFGKKKIAILNYYHCFNYNSNKRYVVTDFSTKDDSLQIFTYIKNDFQQIVKDKLLHAVFKQTENGKEEIQDFNKIHVPDEAYTGVLIIAGKKQYENGYGANDLNDGILSNLDGTIRDKWESLHYKTNMSKPIYLLIEKIKGQLEKQVH